MKALVTTAILLLLGQHKGTVGALYQANNTTNSTSLSMKQKPPVLNKAQAFYKDNQNKTICVLPDTLVGKFVSKVNLMSSEAIDENEISVTENEDYANIELDMQQLENEDLENTVEKVEHEDISFVGLEGDLSFQKNKANNTAEIQIGDDFGTWDSTGPNEEHNDDYDIWSEEIVPEVTTVTWTMIANEQYPCKYVKKNKGKYLYSCYFQGDHSGQIKAKIIPSDQRRDKFWSIKYDFDININKNAPLVTPKPKIAESRIHLWDLFKFPITTRKALKKERIGGNMVDVTKENQQITVDGKTFNKKQFSNWIKLQNPHQTQVYWKYVQEFRFGKDMTEKEAQCYYDRYPDIQESVGNNTKQLIKHYQEQGINERRIKFCFTELSIEEAECYINRYPDLQFDKLAKPSENRQKLLKKALKPNELTIEFARRHYAQWGNFEGRNRHCADRLTNIQAKCYLQNYPDLQDKYGKNWLLAREQYYKLGFTQNRTYECQSIGDQPLDVFKPRMVRVQNDTAPFRCNGDIHYARYSSLSQVMPEQGPEPWSKVRNYDFYTISSNGTQEFNCNNDDLNSRSFLYHKQCFCENKPTEKPRYCAKEKQSCRNCDGQVIYGPRYSKNHIKDGKKKQLTVDEMINIRVWTAQVNTTKDSSIRCEDSTFNIFDRLDKTERQCFCDDMGYLTLTMDTSTQYSETSYEYYTTEHEIQHQQDTYEMETISSTQQEQNFTDQDTEIQYETVDSNESETQYEQMDYEDNQEQTFNDENTYTQMNDTYDEINQGNDDIISNFTTIVTESNEEYDTAQQEEDDSQKEYEEWEKQQAILIEQQAQDEAEQKLQELEEQEAEKKAQEAAEAARIAQEQAELEAAKREAQREKKEAERKAAIEAARKAKEAAEALKKAQEQADLEAARREAEKEKVEAERLAAIEAARIAKLAAEALEKATREAEEAARRELNELKRQAALEVARKAKEAAEKARREQLAAEREAAKKAQEEAERKAAIEAARKAKEAAERARKEQEEAEREAEKQALEEAERLAAIEVAKKAKEAAEATRKAHEEALRLAAQKAKERAEKQARMKAQREAEELKRLQLELKKKTKTEALEKKKAKQELAQKQQQTLVAKMKHEKVLQNEKMLQLKLKTKLRQQRKQREAQIRKNEQEQILKIKSETVHKERERQATEKARTKEAIAKALKIKLAHHAELMKKRQAEHQKKTMLAEQRFKEEEAKDMLQDTIELNKMKNEWEVKEKKKHELREAAKLQAQKLRERQLQDQEKRRQILMEKTRMKKQQHDAEMAKLKAERDSHNAKSKSEIQAAKRAADQQKILIEKARIERLNLNKQMKELKAVEIRLNLETVLALKQAKDAVRRQKKQKAAMLQLQKQADESKKQYEDQIKKQKIEDEKFEKKMATRKAEEEANQKKAIQLEEAAHLEEQRKREEAYKNQKDRILAANAKQEADFKKMMELKKKQHDDLMRNVWAASATGISIATITLPSAEAADELTEALFKKTLIADVADFSKVQKTFRTKLFGNANANTKTVEVHRLVMLTSDDRVADLIEECVDVTKNENSDILIRQLSGIGKEYSKWVGLQTQEETEKFVQQNNGLMITVPNKSKEMDSRFSPQSVKEIVPQN